MRKIVLGITISTSFLLAVFFGGASSNVSGEAFLRTKGGSVITCAGSLVYIEKTNPEGYIFLTNSIKAKKDLKNVLSTIKYLENHKREERLQKLEKNLKNIASWEKQLENSPSDDPIWLKQQIEQVKEGREKYLEEIRKLKDENEEKAKEESKELLAVKKEISKLEERLKNITKETTKETTCNSQGQFVFTELSPDTYYISTTVEWFVGDKKQGGILTKTVILKEGENQIFINK